MISEKPVLENRNAAGDLAPGPLFVASVWRSGSSLLYALLNKHPQISLMYESDLVLLRTMFTSRPKHWAARWDFFNGALSRHGIPAGDLPTERSDFRTAFAAGHKLFARRKGATIWGDKSPNYYDHLKSLSKQFPEARFIVIWRDPLDTVNSVIHAAQAGGLYFRRKGANLRALFGCEALRREFDWLVSHGKSVHQVNYEELVGDPATVLREICLFLKIPYLPSLTNLEGADRSAIHDFGGKHHALVKGNEIARANRSDALPPELRKKVVQYVALWRKRYSGTWPPSRMDLKDVALPSLFARVSDKFRYRALRSYDRFTAVVFGQAPMWLLTKYRDRKYGREFVEEAMRKMAANPRSGADSQ